ncbi:MAG: hypothetical protein KC620_07450, partial [Myxococcales bacterium]|nr:hypothetical protein [Myxococcales bacterium]
MRCLLALSLLLAASPALAQMEELSPLEEDGGETSPETNAPAPAPVLLEEFEVDERDAVLSAARTKTNIQEAPGIVTVITADEIRARGHRTINDVL